MDKLENIKNKIKYLKMPALIAGFLLVFFISYRPFSMNLSNLVAVNPPGRSFLQFWVWREWVSTYFIQSYLHAKPFNLLNLIYFGILSNGTLPETGTVLDIIAISYPLKTWFSIPFPLYYNIKFIIILLFNSLAGYYVMQRFTKREDVGIICGVFMAVNPFLMLILGKARLRAGILGFVILCLYFLYELTQKPNFKTAILCGISLGLTSIFYAFYGMFLLTIILLVFIGKAVLDFTRKRKGEIWKFFKQLVVVFFIFSIIIAPWMIPYLSQIEKREGETKVFGVKFFKDMPDPREVYDPSFRDNPTGHELGIVRLIMAEEMPLRLYFPIVFCLLGILAFFKPRPWVFLMLLIFVVFYLLCLGPYLKFSDNPELEGLYVTKNGKFVPLPYILFYKYIPFISRLHHPDHYLSFASVALMFLSGMGFANLFNFLKKKKLGFFKFQYLNYVIFAGMLIYLVFGIRWYDKKTHFETCRVEVPRFYFQLAKEPFCGIYELPILKNDPRIQEAYDRYDFYQAFHGKKYNQSRYENLTFAVAASGVDKVFSEDYRKLKNEGNKFQEFLENAHKGGDPGYSESDLQQVKDFGYKYIVLHEIEFARYGETRKPPLEGEERFKYYQKAKEYFDKSDQFEFVGAYKEFRDNFIPVNNRRHHHKFKDFEVSVFRIKSGEVQAGRQRSQEGNDFDRGGRDGRGEGKNKGEEGEKYRRNK